MRSVFFWRDVPLDVNLGAFDSFSKLYTGVITVVLRNKVMDERGAVGFDGYENENVKCVSLDANDEAAYAKAVEIINANMDAIHIFSGIKGFNGKVLNCLIKKSKDMNKKPMIGFIGERPLYGVVRSGDCFVVSKIKLFLKNICSRLNYKYLSFKYGRYISVMFVMGQIGEFKYKEYGFKPDIVFPYMYCPNLSLSCERNYGVHSPIRLLYIGRFNFSTKGLDVLIHAINRIPLQENKKYVLDLVGGYGDKVEDVEKWVQSRQNVNFVGTWKVNDVCNKMTDYDVCVVPSRFDGWNLTPNEAIYSGVATIISSEAGSDELISESEAGIVFSVDKKNELSEILKYIIDKPHIVEQWKKNTDDYRKKISPDVIGKYFYDVLEYVFNGVGDRPTCPWRIKIT